MSQLAKTALPAVEYAPERPHVGLLVVLLPLAYLGREVVRRPHDCLGETRAVGTLDVEVYYVGSVGHGD